MDQTDDYTITSADRDNWVKIFFASPIPLIAGTAYEMGIGGYQHPIEFSEVGYSGTALGTENSLYDEIGTSTKEDLLMSLSRRCACSENSKNKFLAKYYIMYAVCIMHENNEILNEI